jgi:ubiquinone biosynthesis protein COQ9
MTQAANDTGQTAEIFATLANEAWQQLGSRPLADLTVAEIAAHVDVETGLAVAVAGDPQQLVLGKMAALDDQAVLESFADIEDAGAVSIREKILEAILHRFEVYAPYRAQIQALNRAARVRPDLALALGLGLQAVTRRMLAMAGDNCDGWRGLMRVKGVVGVVMVVARVWMKDDSPDLAPTMKELDRRLQQAEEWAVSLRLFQQSRRRRGQTAAGEDGQAGRYGVDND